MSLATGFKHTFFRLDYKEVPLDRRGIVCDPAIKPHLEHVLTRFMDGYNMALASASQTELVARLDREIELNFQGFAYEGAAMFLALMDYLTPWKRNRVNEFLMGHGKSHDYIICIGIGFAVARIPWARRNAVSYAARYPAGFAGLVLDGFGFHDGFFHSARTIDRRERPKGLSGYPGRCFDAGIGRSLWFVMGASPERLHATIQRFSQDRQADLWAGLGLACTYAGSAYQDLNQYESVLKRLMEYAGPYRQQLGFGVACAAGTRLKANNPTAWTACACETILDMSYVDAGQLVNDTWSNCGNQGHDQSSLRKHQLVNDRIMARLSEQAQRKLVSSYDPSMSLNA
jgi:hypothetical protein